MKEKLTTALVSIKSWKVYVYSVSCLGKYTFKHEKGHSYINKPSIILVMHLIDIQRVILRYITVTYRDNNQVIWNKKKVSCVHEF